MPSTISTEDSGLTATVGDLHELTSLTPGQIVISLLAAVLAFEMARAARTSPAALRPIDGAFPSPGPGRRAPAGSE